MFYRSLFLNKIKTKIFKKNSLFIENIIEITIFYYGINQIIILKNNRKKKYIFYKKVLIFMLRELLGISFFSIGSILNNLNYNSVLYLYKNCKIDFKYNEKLKKDLLKIKYNIMDL